MNRRSVRLIKQTEHPLPSLRHVGGGPRPRIIDAALQREVEISRKILVVTATIIGTCKSCTDYLAARGFDVRRGSLRKIVEADVLLLTHDDVDDKNVAALQGYVRNGGGIVVAGIGWGWLQLNPAKNLASDYALNRLCLPMGVVWADGIAERTSRLGYEVRLPLPATLNAAAAFAALTNLANGPRNHVPQKELRQISATLAQAVQSLPPAKTLCSHAFTEP